MDDGRGGRWLKIGGIALGLLAVVAILGAILDTGNLGSPDESRRVRHPAGFSLVAPASWGTTVVRARGKSPDSIRVSPEKVTGRETSVEVRRYPDRPALADGATAITFQGRPAVRKTFKTSYDFGCRTIFERDGAWYVVELVSPIELDWDTAPLMRFAETFRTEAATTRIGSLVTTMPVTAEPE